MSRANADALSVDISLPVKSEQEIIDLYVKVCERNKSMKVSKVFSKIPKRHTFQNIRNTRSD